MKTENFTRKCWAPSVTVRDGSLLNYWFTGQCSRHLLCFWHQHLTSLLLVQMHYFLLKNYPHSALGSCCFHKASFIFSIKVDTWYRPKPIRISVCPIHMVGFDMSMWCPWRPETALKWQTDCIVVKEGMIIWGWKRGVKKWRESNRALVTMFDLVYSHVRSESKIFWSLSWWTSLWLRLIWVKFLVTCNVINKYNQY